MSQELIRVSTVIAHLYPGSLDFVQQHHLDEGTRKHELMELWVNDMLFGENPVEPVGEIRPITEWLEAKRIELISAEERTNHKYGFTGKPDARVEWNGEKWIFDWKFAESLSEQNRMQLTVYSRFHGDKVALVQCNKAGKVNVVKVKPDPVLWAAFLNGLGVLRFQQSRKLGVFK